MHLSGGSRCRSKNGAVLFFRALEGVERYTAAPRLFVCGSELRKRPSRSPALFREQRSRADCLVPEGLPIPIASFLDPLRNATELRPLATSRLEKAYRHRSSKCRSDSCRHRQTGLPGGNLFLIRRPTQPRPRLLRRRRPTISVTGNHVFPVPYHRGTPELATVYAAEPKRLRRPTPQLLPNPAPRHPSSLRQFAWRREGGGGGLVKQRRPRMKFDIPRENFLINGTPRERARSNG
jgi:hypothetical protein